MSWGTSERSERRTTTTREKKTHTNQTNLNCIWCCLLPIDKLYQALIKININQWCFRCVCVLFSKVLESNWQPIPDRGGWQSDMQYVRMSRFTTMNWWLFLLTVKIDACFYLLWWPMPSIDIHDAAFARGCHGEKKNARRTCGAAGKQITFDSLTFSFRQKWYECGAQSTRHVCNIHANHK